MMTSAGQIHQTILKSILCYPFVLDKVSYDGAYGQTCAREEYKILINKIFE